MRQSAVNWRKRWDSNPRYGLPHAGFQDRFLKPLGHSSMRLIWFAFPGYPVGKKSAFATDLLPNQSMAGFLAALMASSTCSAAFACMPGMTCE